MTRRFLLLLALAAVPAVAEPQLPYDRTTFLNGFASDSMVWLRGYHDLFSATPPAYLEQYVALGTQGYPDVDDSSSYNQQLTDVSQFFAAGGQHVAVGHSLGSLVARGIYIHNSSGARPNIRGIVAITAPHSGAPLADNADEAVRFFADAQYRIDAARTSAAITFVVAALFFGYAAHAFSILLAPMAGLIAGFGIVAGKGSVGNVQEFANMARAPAVADIKTTSPAIQTLTTRFDDGVLPRANIYGTIPHRNAVLRLAKSIEDKDYEFPQAVRDRNQGLKAFKYCKYVGYGTIVLHGAGRRCSLAAKSIQRIDERWVRYTNGTDGNGRPRYVAFDGVVPNERSIYPSANGVNYQAQVSGVNHQNVYKTRAGLNRVAEGMIWIGMVQLQAPPGSGGGGGGGGGSGGGGGGGPCSVECLEPL